MCSSNCESHINKRTRAAHRQKSGMVHMCQKVLYRPGHRFCPVHAGKISGPWDIILIFPFSSAFLCRICCSLSAPFKCSSWHDTSEPLASCFCLSGTTAKHVVFLAGNTAKHGLRCKACKMSLHHKCENGVGQQRCMGKLVRCMTQSYTRAQDKLWYCAFVFWLTSCEILSFRNVITDVISNQNKHIRIGRLTVSHQNVLIQKSHSYVWVCCYICERHPSSSSSSSSLYHHSVCVLDNANAILLAAAGLCQAAVSINHYIKINIQPEAASYPPRVTAYYAFGLSQYQLVHLSS